MMPRSSRWEWWWSVALSQNQDVFSVLSAVELSKAFDSGFESQRRACKIIIPAQAKYVIRRRARIRQYHIAT